MDSFLQLFPNYRQSFSAFMSPLRSQLFTAMPELRQASNYLQSRFQNPISPDLMSNYRENFQNLVSARGFDPGSVGPAQQGAEYLTGLQEKARQDLVPQVNAFAQNYFHQADLMLNQLNFEENIRTNRQQSDFARDQYRQYQQDLNEAKQRSRSPLDEVEKSRQYYQAEALRRIIPQQFPGLSGPYNAYAAPLSSPGWLPDEGLPTGFQAPRFWGDYMQSWVNNLRGRGLL